MICFYLSKMKAYSKYTMPNKTVLFGEVEYTSDNKRGTIQSKNVVISAEDGKVCKTESRTMVDAQSGSIMNVKQSETECKSMKMEDIITCMRKGMELFEKSANNKNKSANKKNKKSDNKKSADKKKNKKSTDKKKNKKSQ